MAVHGYSVSALNTGLYVFGSGDGASYGFYRQRTGGVRDPSAVQSPGGKPARYAWSDDFIYPLFRPLPILP